MVFIIDIPRVDAGRSSSPTKLTPFGEELCYFLGAQGMDENLIRSLQNYDFSETAPYGFVHSMSANLVFLFSHQLCVGIVKIL